MSSATQRNAACDVEPPCGDDCEVLSKSPVWRWRFLNQRQRLAARALIDLHDRAMRPAPIAAVNLGRPKVDTSPRPYEPDVCSERERQLYDKAIGAMPNEATRRTVQNVLFGVNDSGGRVSLSEAGERVAFVPARPDRKWMITPANKSERIVVAKVLLATGLDVIANFLDSPPTEGCATP